MAFAPEDSPDPDYKGPGVIRQTDASNDVCASSSMQLVWGPGAGVVAAGRLCPRHKKTGVASIP